MTRNGSRALKAALVLAVLAQAILVFPSGAEDGAPSGDERIDATSPSPIPSAPVRSKLTIHTGFQNGGGESWRFIQEAKPGVVKIMDNFGDNGANVARVKQLSPGAIVVGRIYHVNEPGDGDPEQRARDWWDRDKARIRSAPGVDYWEGYNEFATGQESDNADKARWFSRFEAERVRILAGEGLKACIGSFSVGTPPVNNPEHWKALYPAIDEAKAHGGALCLHEYGAPTMQEAFDPGSGEGWLAGRYRKVYNRYLIPDGRGLPLIITETGIDGGIPNPIAGGGWKNFQSWWVSQGIAGDGPSAYMKQLEWYDSLLKADAYVLGATIFSLEIPNWESFDISGEMTTKLIAHVKSGGPAAEPVYQSMTAYGRYWNFDAHDSYRPWPGNGNDLTNVGRYSSGPCAGRPAGGCEFDTRTFLISLGRRIESTTAYGRYWNFDVDDGSKPWPGNGGDLTSVARYSSGPCAGKSSGTCKFDTRAFLSSGGHAIESISAYGRYWNFDTDDGYKPWPGNGNTLASVPRYSSGPCAGKSGTGCAFDTRAVIRLPSGPLAEVITAYGKWYAYDIGAGYATIPRSGSVTDSLAPYATGPCAGRPSGSCALATETVVPAPVKRAEVRIVSASVAPTSLKTGEAVSFTVTMRNDGAVAAATHDTFPPGHRFPEGDTVADDAPGGSWRIGVDHDGRTAALDHPYRWGLGGVLAPGESRTMTGSITLRTAATRDFWLGVVEEKVAWRADRVALTKVTVAPGGPPDVRITSVSFTPTSLPAGSALQVFVGVRNFGGTAAPTHDAYPPGHRFTEGQSVADDAPKGSWRVGVEYTSRANSLDHPYRWGLGGALQPGESRTITGSIVLSTPSTRSYWAGAVEEKIAWRQDQAGTTAVTVTGGGGGSGVSLAGVHWYSGDSGMLDQGRPAGTRGWNVEAIYGVDDLGSRDHAKSMAQRAKDHGLVNIVRIDHRNGQAVPLVAAEHKAWADRFIDRIRDFSGIASIFIVGNEPTIEPGGGTSAVEYATAFNYLYSRRGEMPAGTALLFAGPAAFSWDQRGNRNFLDWLEDASNRVSGVDGFALHAYGDPSVAGCEDPRRACARNGWPFDGGFQTFEQQIDRLAKKWKAGKPIYLTEFNTDVNGRGQWPDPSDNYRDAWINQAFESVRVYNANRGTARPPVKSLCWFVDRDDGGWGRFSLRSIGTARDDMRDEFLNAANSVTSDGGPEGGGGTAGGQPQAGADSGEVAVWGPDRLIVGIATLAHDPTLLVPIMMACALAASSALIYRRTGERGRSRRRVPRPTAPARPA